MIDSMHEMSDYLEASFNTKIYGTEHDNVNRMPRRDSTRAGAARHVLKHSKCRNQTVV